MANATSTDKNEQQLIIQRRADGLALKSNQKNEQRLVPRYPLNVPVTLTNQIKRSEQMNTYAAWVAEIYHEVTKLLTTVGLFPEKHLFANFDPAVGRHHEALEHREAERVIAGKPVHRLLLEDEQGVEAGVGNRGSGSVLAVLHLLGGEMDRHGKDSGWGLEVRVGGAPRRPRTGPRRRPR